MTSQLTSTQYELLMEKEIIHDLKVTVELKDKTIEPLTEQLNLCKLKVERLEVERNKVLNSNSQETPFEPEANWIDLDNEPEDNLMDHKREENADFGSTTALYEHPDNDMTSIVTSYDPAVDDGSSIAERYDSPLINRSPSEGNIDIQCTKEEEFSMKDLVSKLDQLEEIKRELLEIKQQQITRTTGSTTNAQGEYYPPDYDNVIEVFCDSFFKHVDEQLLFGRENFTKLNPCFPTSHLISKLRQKPYDNTVTHVVIQCGFNDFEDNKTVHYVKENFEKILDLIKEKYPYAKVLVGKILPHLNNTRMNNGITTVNYLLKEQYPSLTEKNKICGTPSMSKGQ